MLLRCAATSYCLHRLSCPPIYICRFSSPLFALFISISIFSEKHKYESPDSTLRLRNRLYTTLYISTKDILNRACSRAGLLPSNHIHVCYLDDALPCGHSVRVCIPLQRQNVIGIDVRNSSSHFSNLFFLITTVTDFICGRERKATFVFPKRISRSLLTYDRKLMARLQWVPKCEVCPLRSEITNRFY